MSGIVLRPFPLPDRVLLTASGVLLAIGLVMVTSASITLAERSYSGPLYFFQRHLVVMLAGLAGAGLLLMLPTWRLERLGPWLAGLSLLLLALVLVPGFGQTVNGSTRWLRVAGVSVMQVSEPARLLLLVYLASYVARHGEQLRSSTVGFARPMVVIAVASLLLMRQPDFGATVLLGVIALAVLFAGGSRWREGLGLGVLAGAALAALAIA
ncbi:MAG: FtsW/RodA/SpoVE family cell cycle protein, partial [Chromatiales bacterium]|nr:FtsW/RodA/SpoVE family cell cycle protein [Chromatiales bacterium]